ncbi:pyridoxamine 5'-phosphate oxidase family protein [Lysinibacillus sp. MHQ-1]|nr:pyridoxamine 5'-phosphate oxidase family protein [Lysinibacillus sp. MHQ-1]
MGKVAYVATVDEEGYPYVILFVYVYEGNDKLYLHIGNILESHFWSNIKQNPKISIEVSEMGDLHPGKKIFLPICTCLPKCNAIWISCKNGRGVKEGMVLRCAFREVW